MRYETQKKVPKRSANQSNRKRKRELTQALLGEDGFAAARTGEDIEFLFGGE